LRPVLISNVAPCKGHVTVVPLTPPDATGVSTGCVSSVNQDLIKAIIQHPEEYYINVHNADFPAGAVRGQLSK